jgi:hypothetical protein
MTDEPTACVAESYDPRAHSNLPKFYITVTPTAIRDIYAATGGGAKGTRYLYAVEGLRHAEDRYVGLPCQRTTSRWLPITCTGAADNLDPTVQEIFSNILFYEGDPNPIMRDVWNWWSVECPAPIYQLSGFEVRDRDGTKCWKNVHPEHLNVYDMTYWTQSDGHKGNSPSRNPIKEFAVQGSSTLTFPSWHSMTQWSDNKNNFGFVGRLGDRVHYYSLPKELRSQEVNLLFGFTPSALNYTASKGVLVCGSPFEVANDLLLGGSQGRGAYDSKNIGFHLTSDLDFRRQKRMVWTQIAVAAKDQLRQRVAWALSQILVVTPSAVPDADELTEAMTTYYDIFVRNAFGSYRTILKEVSYSPLMAQMLTYYASKSTAYTWRTFGELAYADENYAREIMQLFTIGMYKLKNDGSRVLESNGNPVRAYTNDDIVEYARVWTGFETRALRGNVENLFANNIDPMRINVEYRDVFPKMGLNRKYIGDGVPLCTDMPAKHFLKKGATYRLLGRSPAPLLMSDPKEWLTDKLTKRMKLLPNGVNSLHYKLCGSRSASTCTQKPTIVLNANLGCFNTECSVDTVRVVEVGTGIYYEYVPMPCVYQAFYQNAKMIVRSREWWDLTCADPRIHIASSALCVNGTYTPGKFLDLVR